MEKHEHQRRPQVVRTASWIAWYASRLRLPGWGKNLDRIFGTDSEPGSQARGWGNVNKYKGPERGAHFLLQARTRVFEGESATPVFWSLQGPLAVKNVSRKASLICLGAFADRMCPKVAGSSANA